MSLREEAWIPTVGQDSHFTTFWGVPDPFFGTVLSVASPRVQPPLMGAALALSLGGRGLSASPPLLLVCGQGGGQARNELEPSRHPSEPRVPPGDSPALAGREQFLGGHRPTSSNPSRGPARCPPRLHALPASTIRKIVY